MGNEIGEIEWASWLGVNEGVNEVVYSSEESNMAGLANNTQWKRFKKSLKTAEKSSLTSFLVRAAPQSWSKYTTIGPIEASLIIIVF